MFYIVCLDLWNVIWVKKIPRIAPEISSTGKTTMTLLPALFHHAKSVAGKSRWVLGTRTNGRVSINTLICGLKPILPPTSTPSKYAYHHRNCLRKYIIHSFYDDWVQQVFGGEQPCHVAEWQASQRFENHHAYSRHRPWWREQTWFSKRWVARLQATGRGCWQHKFWLLEVR